MEIKILATGSSGNCYHISDGVSELLIECGIKYTEILRKLDYKMSNISAVLISHSHEDHSLSVNEFILYGYDLVMPPETAVKLLLNGNPNVFTPLPGRKITVGTFSIVPFELVHFNNDGSDCACYGYLIASKATREKLLFATDTAYIRNQFRGVTHMLLEVNYMSEMIGDFDDVVDEVEKRRLKSHMSLETAVEFLNSTDRTQLKALYAIHGSSTRLDKDKAYRVLEPYAERVFIP